MSQTFVHLHLHSAYSLAEGAIKVKDLVKLTRAHNMPAVAVSDTNNMFGAMEFALEASKNGVQPILGCQLNLSDESQIVLLIQNEKGYRNLCQLVSEAHLEGFENLVGVTRERLTELSEGLICLSGGLNGPVSKHLLEGQSPKAEEDVAMFKAAFGDRFYIEVQRHGWAEEDRIEPELINLAYKYDVPLVATNDCFFVDRGSHQAHDALLCIAEGRYVTEDDRRKVTQEHFFKSPEEMIKLFEDLPEAVENTVQIARRCSYLLEPIDPLLPPFECEGDRTEIEELKAQAEEGLRWRLDNFVIPFKDDIEDLEAFEKPYHDRLKFELDIIVGMGFPGYFLICSDFISWAKLQSIPVGPGRGSGAGSLVAWSLKITDLDPLEFGLLFERFLNPERVSMPDFDIDFCQERRDEVIKYVQDKYGHDKVAQIITFGKLQARAVVRDVGRVLQMPYGQVDRLSKMIPNNPANPVTLQEALDADPDFRLEIKKEETSERLIEIALQLEGLYRHASTHAAGVVIGDRPLHELIPLYRDPRSDMPVTQFNMKYVEQAGLVKFDFLGLKTMTVVQKSVEHIKETTGEEIDVLKIPLDDQKTYDLIAAGNTVGVFQLESAGMRDALRKVRPDKFEDIIALVSLYRPGPMDNIPKYVDVKQGREEPDYMHPLLQPFLEETYGIMIYQEQVQLAARALAGYSLGGADLLRRAMGKKIQEEMDKQRKMFMDGAKEHNDVPKEKSGEIFDQIAKFAGYGFNKSHAAAYALIAYWTAWLKANHPIEFFAASMTLDLGNTDKLSVFKQDMDRMSLELRGPDINKSFPRFAVEQGSVRYALAALKGVGEQAMVNIVTERSENGEYDTLEDFVSRLDPKNMNRRQYEKMVNAGVFDSLNSNRAQMAASSDIVLKYAQSLAEERETGQDSLFGGGDDGGGGLGLPDLPNIKPLPHLETLAKEFDSVGFYLSAHPLDTRAAQFERMKIGTYAQIEEELVNRAMVRKQVAAVLLKKQEKMSQKGSKYAFLQLSDPSGVYEIMIFSETLNASREILEPGQSLLLVVEAESKEDQIRMLGGGIQQLDEALEGKIREIKIHLTSPAGLKKLKEFLDIEGQGAAKISLYMPANDDGQLVHINLPGRWSLSAQARNLIRAEPGVENIWEV